MGDGEETEREKAEQKKIKDTPEGKLTQMNKQTENTHNGGGRSRRRARRRGQKGNK